MFILVALTIWILMNAYVVWRIGGVPFVAAHLPRGLVVATGVFFASAYIVARIIEIRSTSTLGVALEWTGAMWMGFATLALACFFIADLASGFGFVFPKQAVTFRTIAFAVIVILSVAALFNARRTPAVRDFEVRMKNLPPERDGMTVAYISDLHVGTLTTAKWFADRAAQVNALKPDLILIGGDLFEGSAVDGKQIPETVRSFRAPLGVVAVPGNHDGHSPKDDAILTDNGVHLLRDRSIEVAPNLFVAGVDTTGHQRIPGRGLVEKAMAAVPRSAATILLYHYPEQVEKAARAGAGLMLSGHTHNGQIWPFGIFVRMAYRYLAGRYDVEGMPLIVCRGTGTWGPTMRLFRPNEILRITLRRM